MAATDIRALRTAAGDTPHYGFPLNQPVQDLTRLASVHLDITITPPPPPAE